MTKLVRKRVDENGQFHPTIELLQCISGRSTRDRPSNREIVRSFIDLRESMRGIDQQQNHIFSYLSPESRVRKDHPLHAIRFMVDVVLAQLSPQFDRMYATMGRPSIPPEKLLRAQLLQMLYTIRSERLLMEE